MDWKNIPRWLYPGLNIKRWILVFLVGITLVGLGAAYILIEVSNLVIDDKVSTLAWDICNSLAEILMFKKEIIICWEGIDEGEGKYGCGYDHSYCLVFQNEDPN